MKKIYCLIGIVGLLFSSCMNKNIYRSDDKDDSNELDLSFKFEMRSEKHISVTVNKGDGQPVAEALIAVYTQQPYSGDGYLGDSEPVYVGYTDASGMLEDKIEVPGNIKKLYVVPLTAGCGAMQTVEVQEHMALNFKGTAFQETNPGTKAPETNRIENIQPVLISGLYQLFVPYADNEIGENGIPLVDESPLISKENISSQLLNRIDSWYPEKQNVVTEDLRLSSDLVVNAENGAEVWVTYVGDGGYSQSNPTSYNLLAYYHYRQGELHGRADVSSMRMTVLLPNTHQGQCPQGLKVQLLYWDGKDYRTVFPNGTHIGFAVARDGFDNNGQAITAKGAYRFKNTGYPKIDDPAGFYYSTPMLNPTFNTQAIIRASLDDNCCIMGFDIRRSDDKVCDFDFNDVIVKITSSPVLAVFPEEDIPVIDETTPTESVFGTLAFEDQWPDKGDYDFNDFVIDYAYRLTKDKENRITGIEMNYTPVAKGAATYTRIGFGIELPVDPADIRIEGPTDVTLEQGTSLATLIAWENVNTAFGGKTGFINTEVGGEFIQSKSVGIDLTFKTPVERLPIGDLNPFIFVNERSHEIHLVDHAPTDKMDRSLLGTRNDRSDETKGVYFRMDNYYPWALDFPRTQADVPSWRYPREKVSIVDAYLNYMHWVLDKTDISWFDASVSGNVNEENLYR